MKLRVLFYLLIIILPFYFLSCEDKNENPDSPPGEKTDNEITNEWMYGKMKRLYLWNDKLPRVTNYNNEPEEFFYSILYDYGKKAGDRFSWIEEDKTKKTKSGTAAQYLGFTYLPEAYFATTDSESNSVGFFVTSVQKDSDAYKKGLRRGQLIYKVNNTDINNTNYIYLLEQSSLQLSLYDLDGKQKTLDPISANAPTNSPVIFSKVIEKEGIKIGYLVYNSFTRGIDEDNDEDFTYDIELMDTIANMKSKGIQEFILDLRYNPGGYLTSAIAMASALVPNRNTSNIFLKEEYNISFQDSIVNKYGERALNEYFMDKIYSTNVVIPKLNLNRLFVIATSNSASASEAVINGLKPYMNVYHIGETTVGKDKASMTIKSDNEKIKWQLQPIISRITDSKGKGNYIDGLKPDFEISEFEECYEMVEAYYMDEGKQVEVKVPAAQPWKTGFIELGDLSEPLLAEAIARITGIPREKKAKSVSTTPAKRISPVKLNEDRYRTIIDENKFKNLEK